jgi:hypothetical protein
MMVEFTLDARARAIDGVPASRAPDEGLRIFARSLS